MKLQTALDRATSDATAWPSVCDAVAKLFGAVGGIILPVDPAFRGPWFAQSATLEKTTNAYLSDGWKQCDFRQAGLQFVGAGRHYFTDDDLGDRKELREQPYYKDFLIPLGLGYSIVIALDVEAYTKAGKFCLSLQFPFDRSAPSKDEIDLVQTVREAIMNTVNLAFANSDQNIRDLVWRLSEASGSAETFDLHGQPVRRMGSTGISSHWDSVLRRQIDQACRADPYSYVPVHLPVGEGPNRKTIQILQLPRSLRHFFLWKKSLC